MAGEMDANDNWPFTYQQLKRVVDNSEKYIENPAKRDWGCLKTAFGPA
jgi:hypothetical protein